MNCAYLQGFAAKCAEYGVDPAQLLKLGTYGQEPMDRVFTDLNRIGNMARIPYYSKTHQLGQVPVPDSIARELIANVLMGKQPPVHGIVVPLKSRLGAEPLRLRMSAPVHKVRTVLRLLEMLEKLKKV